VAPASGAPQLAQYLPVAAAPQAGQAAVESDEGGDVMRVKIVGRRLMCSEIQTIWDETAAYDYRLGASGRAGSGLRAGCPSMDTFIGDVIQGFCDTIRTSPVLARGIKQPARSPGVW